MSSALAFASSHYGALAIFVLVCWGLGHSLLANVLRTSAIDRWLGHALCTTLGIGIFICVLQVLGVAGVLLRPGLLGLLALGGLWALRTVWAEAKNGYCLSWPSWHHLTFQRSGAALAVVLVACWVLFDPLKPPHEWDELAYHLPHAQQWAHSGRLQINDWLRYPWFPFNYDLLYASGLVLLDDIAPHLLHALAGWAIALMVFRLGARYASNAEACLASILWLRMVRADFSNAYIDMGVTLFVLSACIAFQMWREEPQQRCWLALAAFCMGLAVGSKYQALTFVPLFGAVVLWRDRRPGTLAVACVFLLLPCMYWYARNAWMTGDPVAPLGGKIFGFSDWNLADYTAQFADIHRVYGWPHPAFWAAALAPCLPSLRASQGLRAAMVFCGYAVLVWTATSHYPRYLMPAYPLLALLAVCVYWRLAAVLLRQQWQRYTPATRQRLQTGGWAMLLTTLTLASADTLARKWPQVAATAQARQSWLRHTLLAPYGDVLDYLRTQPVGKVYQSGLEGVLYYAPQPIWGDSFGPWRSRDFLTLAPGALAAKLAQQQFSTLVLHTASHPDLLAHPDFPAYFSLLHRSENFAIYRVTAPLP